MYLCNVSIKNNIYGKFISLHRQQEIHITWFGGEPLLGFDRIYSICKHLRQLKIKFASDMITNGSLLNESIIQKMDILNLKYIQISLDGIAETHDKRRIFNNGTPSFNLIIENIRKLVSLTDIPLSIKVTMDHTNPTSLSDITNYFNDNFSEYLKKGQIAISHNYVRDRTDFDKSGNCFTHEDLLKQDQDALRNKEKALVYPELPNLAMPCMFRCKNSLAIDSKGHIYKCLEHLGLPNNKVGDLVKEPYPLKNYQKQCLVTTLLILMNVSIAMYFLYVEEVVPLIEIRIGGKIKNTVQCIKGIYQKSFQIFTCINIQVDEKDINFISLLCKLFLLFRSRRNKRQYFSYNHRIGQCCGERTYATCENQRERFQDSGCQYCAFENGYGNENVVAYTGSAFG